MFNLMLSDLVYIATVTAVQLSTAITGEFWSVLENEIEPSVQRVNLEV